MTKNDIANAKNTLLAMALPALQRAARNAREQAIIHNTRLIIWKDNHVVKLSPKEIREQLADYQVEE